MMRHIGLISIALVTMPTLLHGQTMYRCTEGGKTTYSDRPCSSGAEVRRIAADGGPTPEDVARARMRAQADKQRDAEARMASAQAPVAASPQPTAAMSSYEAGQRMRDLKVTLASTTIDKEKRRAAQDELDRLQRGVAQQLSPDDQKRMRDLRVGLASTNQRTRADAEARQRAILDQYDSPAVIAERNRSEAAAAKAQAAQRAEEARIAAEAAASANAAMAESQRAARPAATHITGCTGATCVDNVGNVYHGQGPITHRSDGKTCHQSGATLICN